MSSAATVEVTTREIPTYVLGPDSPYLSYPWERWNGHYPYSTKLDLSTERTPVCHRVIVLENACLRAEVLPDMGGRLFRLFDKVAKQETFMVPPSIKYANVALRGAWIAGGIEWNFGRYGHSLSTVDPVSWTTRTEADGSASVIVGATIRPVESRWAVRMTLKPDRAAIDFHILNMGPRQWPGTLYWWTNAAVQVGEQSKFYFWGKHMGDEFRSSWPISDGIDYRWYRNRIYKGDTFIMEPARDYMGFYDFARDHGLAQTADRVRMPGQKYFTWGADQRGRYWDIQFSDSEQTYCEIQRGRLPTQHHGAPIAPMAVDEFTETWMPLNRIGGLDHFENDMALAVVDANRPGQYERGGNELRLLSALRRTNVRVEAFADERPVGTWTISVMEPGAPQALPVRLPGDSQHNRVKCSDASGAICDWVEHRFGDEDWTRHIRPADAKSDSVEQSFRHAEEQRFLDWPIVGSPGWSAGASTVGQYHRLLRRERDHAGAQRALAEIDFFNGLTNLRETDLCNVLWRHGAGSPRRDATDAAAWALLGWTMLALRREGEAVEPFSRAADSDAGASNLVGLAWAQVRLGDFSAAVQALNRLQGERPNDRWGCILKVILLRRAGRTAEATQRLSALLAIDPLWSAACAEAALLDLPPHLSNGARRLADDSVTAALPYLDLGLWDDAARVLAIDESDEPWSPAVRLAHLAYAQLKAGDRDAAERTRRELGGASLARANPWATASIGTLQELAGVWPAEPVVRVLLGNILCSRQRFEEALTAWGVALDLGVRDTVLYASLAAVGSRLGREEALTLYRRAWELAGNEPHLFVDFDRFLAKLGSHQERDDIYRQLPERLRQRSIVALRRVPQLLDLERYQDALEELSCRQFLSGEKAEYAARRTFLESLLGRGVELMNAGDFRGARAIFQQGLTYPRNHNAGRSHARPQESLINCMLGLVCDALGDAEAAQKHWVAAAHELNVKTDIFRAYEMLAWLALDQKVRVMAATHHFEGVAFGDIAPLADPHMPGPSHADVQLLLGLAQVAKGRVAQARQAWAAALECEPDARMLRPHINMSDAVLMRMCRAVTGPVQ